MENENTVISEPQSQENTEKNLARLEQRRKALEKANQVRSEKAALKRREKEIQARVYANYKKEILDAEKSLGSSLEVVEAPLVHNEEIHEPAESPPSKLQSGEVQRTERGHSPLNAADTERPPKHIKLENKRRKKVLLEWSDSDSDVDDDRLKTAFKSYRKKSGPPDNTVRQEYGRAVSQMLGGKGF